MSISCEDEYKVCSKESPIPVSLVSDGQFREQLVQPIPTRELRSRPMTPQLDFKNRIAFDFASIPEVEAVFTSEYSKVFFVWTVVKERSPELYRRIYDVERAVMDNNQSIAFDFTIMPANGNDPRLIVRDPLAKLAYLRS
jgi:hypothetical protein